MESGCFCANDQYFTRRDGLNSYLLMVTTAGCGRIGWQGQRASLVRGDAVLIDCNLYQEYATAPGQTWDFHFLHFHALSLDGYREALFAGLTPVRLRSLDAAVERMLQIVGGDRSIRRILFPTEIVERKSLKARGNQRKGNRKGEEK